jgi:HAD superfamily hydrolase (TIGR01549 family)
VDGGTSGTLRISNIAAVIANDHEVHKDAEVKARFFELLDSKMDETGPDKSLVKLLKKFAKEPFRLGLVTFVRKPRITRRLETWRLNEYFQSVVTPDDEPDFKPSPKPFRRAMEQLRVKPVDCYMIGDEPVDMIGGKKAGATTIGLPQGFFSREELEKAGADNIITSLGQLSQIVTPSL